MGRLNGKVALITGASGGIGRTAALLFAKEGARLVVASRGQKAGEAIVAEIKKAGGQATFVPADVALEADVIRAVKAAIAAYGRIDILYNSAAIVHAPATTTDITLEEWQKTINVNLTGTWLTMKYAIPEMIKTGGGSVINTASIAALVGVPNQIAYSASKGGVISITRVAAVEYGPKKVRVNCLCPGPVATPMLEGFYGEEGTKYLGSLNPRGTIGRMEEIANIALFLASDESIHIVGQVIVADGGHTADSHVRW